MVEVVLRKALTNIAPVKFFFIVYKDMATGKFYHNGWTVVGRDRIKIPNSVYFDTAAGAVLSAYEQYQKALEYANSEI